MKYAFKMMAVVLAVGVLVLQGCVTVTNSYDRTSSYNRTGNSYYMYNRLADEIANMTDKKLMGYACNNGLWRKSYSDHVIEAKKRFLDCEIKGVANTFSVLNSSSKTNSLSSSQRRMVNYSDYVICLRSNWKEGYYEYKDEAKRRGLDCGVGNSNKLIASNNESRSNASSWNNAHLCSMATSGSGNSWTNETHLNFAVLEAKKRGLNCGVKKNNEGVVASKTRVNKPIISSVQLDAEKQKLLELERELAQLKNKQKKEQQRINTDSQNPIINAFTKLNGPNATISGRVTDNTEVAEVLINGQAQQVTSNGTFETNFYIPRTGKVIEIIAIDTKGNKASKTMKIERGNIKQANIQQFKSLNPSLKTVKSNPNALALIIGISDYENTKASALYADSDAKTFYDYANMKLGIPSSNIRELIGNNAERLDIVKSVRNFLLKRTITDKTDIYVFFAGHGLATDDGKGMYLLPYDGDPDYLEDSAIQRKELFADIQATKPRSVTVFLDTCYSGGTRNEETLVASLRPIIITAKQQAIPNNFTVLSAAKSNQTSQSLEEVKHGLFSYYTMLGMEGGADTNNDNKITARELHAFIKDKVERQSQFRQTPELQGDKDRVLIQFN